MSVALRIPALIAGVKETWIFNSYYPANSRKTALSSTFGAG